MFSNLTFQDLLRSELDSLPLPPRDSWWPRPQRSRESWGIAAVLGALVFVAILLGVGNGLAARIAQRDDTGSVLTTVSPRPTATTTGTQPGRPFECPSGQSPILEFSTHPNYAGTTPEVALSSAHLTVGEVTTFPMEPGPGAWVVTGSNTFLAYPATDGSWVLYPARFRGCR